MHTKLEVHARAESEGDILRRLEDDVGSGLDKMETLSRELEDTRRGRDATKRDTLIRKVFTFFYLILVIHLMYLSRTRLRIRIHTQLQQYQIIQW